MTAPLMCPHCGQPVTTLHPLTDAQSRVLAVVQQFIRYHGIAPKLSVIAHELGLRSIATVYEHLRQLERKGYIRRDAHSQQAITLLVTDTVSDPVAGGAS